MKILIAGDLVPTESNKEKFAEEDFIDYLDEEFKDKWLNSDYRMFNLECPLGKNLNPIDKSGPNLLADEKCIYGIKSLQPNLVFLSNNHVLDYGIEGLNNTEKILKQYDIEYTGILENNQKEYMPYYIKDNDIKVGIYNVCENEFSIATRTSKGANALSEIKNYKEEVIDKKENN